MPPVVKSFGLSEGHRIDPETRCETAAHRAPNGRIDTLPRFPTGRPRLLSPWISFAIGGKIVRLRHTDLESYPPKGERIGFILDEQSPLSTRSARTSGLAVGDAVGRETPEQAVCSSSSF
jgi:hypothetical protein